MNTKSKLHRAIQPSWTGLLAASLVFSFVGCVSAPPPPVPKMTISARLPVISVIPDGVSPNGLGGEQVRKTTTEESKEKGGVEITIVPVLYKAAVKEKYEVQTSSPGLGHIIGASLVTAGNSRNLIFVTETITPFLAIEPGRLQFTVRVNNKLARVFRGQGAVVQFNVGGKLIPFDRIDYKNFLNGIVPPRNESEFVISGPAFDMMPDKGTIGIFLYDVVTATDVAGNVTEKQNYEWYFDYSTKVVEEQAAVRAGQTYMDAGRYQQALMKAKKRSVDEPDTAGFYNFR